MKLSPMIETFVVHFGEMGSKWGFNRTVGQMYALIVMNEEPINATQMSEALSVSRGNVSMGLKELQSWGLIQLQHKQGDRNEYYSPKGDLWDMANKVFEERRKREVDPTLSLLRDIILDEPANDKEIYAQARMKEIHDLLETVTHWAAELQGLSPETLNNLMKLGSGVIKALEMKNQLKSKKASISTKPGTLQQPKQDQ